MRARTFPPLEHIGASAEVAEVQRAVGALNELLVYHATEAIHHVQYRRPAGSTHHMHRAFGRVGEHPVSGILVRIHNTHAHLTLQADRVADAA